MFKICLTESNKMLHNEVFHQDVHCLLGRNQLFRDHVCINPILWIGLIHRVSIDSKSLITL